MHVPHHDHSHEGVLSMDIHPDQIHVCDAQIIPKQDIRRNYEFIIKRMDLVVQVATGASDNTAIVFNRSNGKVL